MMNWRVLSSAGICIPLLNRVLLALVTVTALTLSVGCKTKEDAGTTVDLVGTAWKLQALGSADALQDVLPGTEVTLSFGVEGSASGLASCNSYHGPFNIAAADSLSFGLMASTRMMCGDPPGVMEQEAAYLSALERVRTYRLQDELLELRGVDGSALIFKRAR